MDVHTFKRLNRLDDLAATVKKFVTNSVATADDVWNFSATGSAFFKKVPDVLVSHLQQLIERIETIPNLNIDNPIIGMRQVVDFINIEMEKFYGDLIYTLIDTKNDPLIKTGCQNDIDYVVMIQEIVRIWLDSLYTMTKIDNLKVVLPNGNVKGTTQTINTKYVDIEDQAAVEKMLKHLLNKRQEFPEVANIITQIKKGE